MDWLSDARPRFDQNQLLPVIAQDASDGSVLMLAWANSEALAATEQTGQAHFWSRSRQQLWQKGESSGNVMDVLAIGTDCDGDALLYRVRPHGPACHTGDRTCFSGDVPPGVMSELAARVRSRRDSDTSTSYTARLLAGGPRRPAEKLVEEAGELAAAALVGSAGDVASEAGDLIYHLLVLLESRSISLTDVETVLASRR